MAMISSFGPPRLAGWTAAILLASATTAFADCGDLLQRLNQALEQRSLAEVTALEKQIAADAACGNRLVEVRQRRATLQLLLAQQLVDKGAKIPDYEGLVVDADKPDVSWLAAKMLGDMRFAQRAFADAARAYDRAVEIIKNASKTPSPPREEQIKAVTDLAIDHACWRRTRRARAPFSFRPPRTIGMDLSAAASRKTSAASRQRMFLCQ